MDGPFAFDAWVYDWPMLTGDEHTPFALRALRARETAETASGATRQRLSRSALFAYWNALRGDAYDLDVIERFVRRADGKIPCVRRGLVRYTGTTLQYRGAILVNEAFLERLARFEEVVANVAEETYGRRPLWIRHYGAYSCRTSRNRAHRLSEHALGNALDVVGFDFGPADDAATLPEGLPERLSRAFQVRVLRHWGAEKGVAAIHARFLRTITERLINRGDVFRGMIGPGHRDHADHFHFDMSPWRYIRL
ncbi:MAG: extensin family protein [Pseudomonadota bacterium]|nr:MAG: hypothetical protein DIU78_05450 [Pseudomonadota bacterium]